MASRQYTWINTKIIAIMEIMEGKGHFFSSSVGPSVTQSVTFCDAMKLRI